MNNNFMGKTLLYLVKCNLNKYFLWLSICFNVFGRETNSLFKIVISFFKIVLFLVSYSVLIFGLIILFPAYLILYMPIKMFFQYKEVVEKAKSLNSIDNLNVVLKSIKKKKKKQVFIIEEGVLLEAYIDHREKVQVNSVANLRTVLTFHPKFKNSQNYTSVEKTDALYLVEKLIHYVKRDIGNSNCIKKGTHLSKELG